MDVEQALKDLAEQLQTTKSNEDMFTAAEQVIESQNAKRRVKTDHTKVKNAADTVALNLMYEGIESIGKAKEEMSKSLREFDSACILLQKGAETGEVEDAREKLAVLDAHYEAACDLITDLEERMLITARTVDAMGEAQGSALN